MYEAVVRDSVLNVLKSKAFYGPIKFKKLFIIHVLEQLLFYNSTLNVLSYSSNYCYCICHCPQIQDLENALAQEKLKCLEVISLTL